MSRCPKKSRELGVDNGGGSCGVGRSHGYPVKGRGAQGVGA